MRKSTLIATAIILCYGAVARNGKPAFLASISDAKDLFKSEYVDKNISEDGHLIVRELDRIEGLEEELWIGWKMFPGMIVPDWESAKVSGTKVETEFSATQTHVAYSGAYTHPELPPHVVYISQRLIVDTSDGSLRVAYKIPPYSDDISFESGNRDPFDGDGVVLYYDLTQWDLIAVERFRKGEPGLSVCRGDADFERKAKEIIGDTFVAVRMVGTQDEYDQIHEYYTNLKKQSYEND
jgi:hypothetical protein